MKDTHEVYFLLKVTHEVYFYFLVTHEVRLRIINVTNANYNYITIIKYASFIDFPVDVSYSNI